MGTRFRYSAALSLAATLLFVAAGREPAWGYGNFMATQGARATGMGWCTVASPTDASTIFFNPAGMSTLKGLQLYGGGSFYFADVKYDPGVLDPGASPAKANLGLFFPMSGFMTYNLGPVALGFGLTNPYGLGGRWPDDWAGRYIYTKTNNMLFNFNLAASVALKEIFPSFPELYLGAGFQMTYGYLQVRQHFTFAPNEVYVDGRSFPVATSLFNAFLGLVWDGDDGQVKLSGTGTGYGYNLGLLYRITDWLAVGLSYQAPVKMNYSGTAFFDMPGLSPAVSSLFFADDDDVTIQQALPSELMFGIAADPVKDLTLEFDFWWGDWHNFKTLNVLFSEPANADVYNAEWYGNGFAAAVGVEWRHFKAFPLRAGFMYSWTPIPDHTFTPILPDADQPFVNFGAGYHPEKWPILIPESWKLFVDVACSVFWGSRTKNNDMPLNIVKPLSPGSPVDVVVDMSGYEANGEYTWTNVILGISAGLAF